MISDNPAETTLRGFSGGEFPTGRRELQLLPFSMIPVPTPGLLGFITGFGLGRIICPCIPKAILFSRNPSVSPHKTCRGSHAQRRPRSVHGILYRALTGRAITRSGYQPFSSDKPGLRADPGTRLTRGTFFTGFSSTSKTHP